MRFTVTFEEESAYDDLLEYLTDMVRHGDVKASRVLSRLGFELVPEEDDGQPTEHEEWMSFDPDC